MDDPGSRALEYGQRAATTPADQVTQDRVTREGVLTFAAINADEAETTGGGSGSAATLPLPWPRALDAKLNVVAANHPLRAAVDVVAGTKKYKGIAFAVVDLTQGAPGLYAGSHDKEQRFIASTGKLAILFSAFQLRSAMRAAAAVITDKKIKTDVQLFDAIMRPWRREITRFFHGTKTSHDSLPSLAQIFSAVPRSGGGWQVEFADVPRGGTGKSFEDRLRGAVTDSDDPDAGSCIRDLGFPYIHGCMAKSGLWVRGKGLWIALDYAGQWWWPETAKEVGTAQGATAQTLVRMLTLLDSDELVPGSRTEMLDLLSGARGGKHFGAVSRIKDGVMGYLPSAEQPTLDVRSKVGFIDKPNTESDAALVRHGAGAQAVKYAAAILNAFDENVATDAARALDIAIRASHAPPP
jgi:hypothetical protein